jgi:hypothetical protein
MRADRGIMDEYSDGIDAGAGQEEPETDPTCALESLSEKEDEDRLNRLQLAISVAGALRAAGVSSFVLVRRS